MELPLAFPAQLSQHLRSLRKSKGLSQVQLADLMGVAQSRIANIEKDATKLTAQQLFKLLALLDGELVIKTRTHEQAACATNPTASNTTQGEW